jgi:HAD superfamily hydrolase (TIGR01509 family)
MDGVIVDSEQHHEQAFLDVLREIGYGGRLGLRFDDYIGRTDQELWTDFIVQHKPAQSFEDLLARKRERMVAIIRREQPLFDGVPALVEKLAARYGLALASGSERMVVDEVLKLKGLGRFFSAVVTSSDVRHGKPAPDIFLRTAELLKLPPQSCCVVEDSKPGIEGSLAADMQVIAITNTHPAEELRHATHVVRTYGEIERLLLGSG